MEFNDGSALRLTVARYYTPTGRSIQRPYENGKEAYYADHYHRMIDDMNPQNDSLSQPKDSTEYITPKGKILYGGGGIMPDFEISLDTSFNYYLYNRLLRNSIIVEYGIDYYNQHPEIFDPYVDLEEFAHKYQPEHQIYQQIIQAGKDQDLNITDKEIRDNKSLVLNTFKSEIARLIYGEKAYYYVYLQEDKIYKEAVLKMME